MATWILINTTTLAGDKRLAGRTFDDAQESLTPWTNAGAVFFPTSDATIAAAAVVAQNKHAQGANEATLDAIMTAAVEASQASVATGQGASLVGIEDAGGFTAAVNVEAALAELYQHVKSGTVTKEIPISIAILAAGTPMAAFADAEGATPGITLANSKAMGIQWNDHATPTAIFLRFNMPDDIDLTANASLDIYASKIGATGGDLPTFLVTMFNNAVGALHDADTDYGGTSAAMTNPATKTVQKVSLVLALADLGLAGAPVTMSIKPTNGTLGTDDLVLHGINLVYKRKVKTS